MIQIEEYCRLASASGGDRLEVVGCYAANERVDDLTPGFNTLKLANKLVDFYPHAPLLLLNNNWIAHTAPRTAVQTWRQKDGKWRHTTEDQYAASSDTLGKVKASLTEGRIAWDCVFDFEEHLANPSKRWLP